VENSVISNSIIQTHTRIKNANITNSMIGNHTVCEGTGKDLSVGDYNVLTV
jgi:glucose-1-phosphate thymidylyltransferase